MNQKNIAIWSRSLNDRENEELNDLGLFPFNAINHYSDTLVLRNFSEAERFPD
jgi:hypothetical protein